MVVVVVVGLLFGLFEGGFVPAAPTMVAAAGAETSISGSPLTSSAGTNTGFAESSVAGWFQRKKKIQSAKIKKNSNVKELPPLINAMQTTFSHSLPLTVMFS